MRRKRKILVVDDNQKNRELLVKMILKNYPDWIVEDCEGSNYIRRKIDDNEFRYDLIVLDLILRLENGLDILRYVRKEHARTEVIIITGYENNDLIQDCLKNGALEVLRKPVHSPRLINSMKNAFALRNAMEENKLLRQIPPGPDHYQELVGTSKAMVELKKLLRLIKGSLANIVISGETGTGKSVIARLIHNHSSRYKGDFIVVNCAAIPDSLIDSELFGHEKGAFTGADSQRRGCFEIAQNGTIFLDEISELSIKAQARLLRVIESKKIRRIGAEKEIDLNCRVICATNQSLLSAVAEKKFRADLYYRLSVISLETPPLRARENDVILLINHFLTQYSDDKKISAKATRFLSKQKWLGNIRQLQNCVYRAVVHNPSKKILSARDFNLLEEKPISEPQSLEEYEILAIQKAISKTKNRTLAAERLKIAKSTLYEKIKKYKIL